MLGKKSSVAPILTFLKENDVSTDSLWYISVPKVKIMHKKSNLCV